MNRIPKGTLASLMKHVVDSRPSVPPSPRPGPERLVVVAPGRSEQFWFWFEATKDTTKAYAINRGTGTILMEDGTKYQCITRVERAMGLPYGTPVISIGTYTEDRYDVIERLRVRGGEVTHEEY